MLQVIDTRWLAYLTQMDHLREGMGFQAYGQMDPLVEYKAAAFTAFQDLTEDIQREIVRALLNVQIRRVDPGGWLRPRRDVRRPEEAVAAAPTAGAAEATAPQSPRADRPGGATDGTQVPPARPAAALASGALARATGDAGLRAAHRRSRSCATSWSRPRREPDASDGTNGSAVRDRRARDSRARSAATRPARAARGRSTSTATASNAVSARKRLAADRAAWRTASRKDPEVELMRSLG